MCAPKCPFEDGEDLKCLNMNIKNTKIVTTFSATKIYTN